MKCKTIGFPNDVNFSMIIILLIAHVKRLVYICIIKVKLIETKAI